MRLTVIGSASPYPSGDNPCSCFLVQAGDANVLVDCGAGALMGLSPILAPAGIDAVIISHFHGDHMSDLLVLKYAIALGMSQGVRTVPLVVHCPREPGELVELVRYKDAVDCQPIDPGETRDIAGLRCTAFATEHSVPSLGFRLESEGRTLVYTGDAGPSPDLVTAASGADVLLAEATYSHSAVSGQVPGHLSGSEAGALARDCGCGRLIITHVSAFSDPVQVLADAAHQYSGEILLARPGLSVEV